MTQEFIEDNVIIISKQTLDEFLKEENPADLISLYVFYYYTAKWQKTNQPKCTDKYIKKGLHWGIERVIKAKKILIDMKLIETVNKRNKKGIIEGWYIKLNYIWKQETTQNTQNKNLESRIPENQKVDSATCGKQETNALNAVNINALNANNESFEKFWKLYDYKKERKKCETKWKYIPKLEHDKIFEHVIKYVKSTPDKQYRKHPLTYLNGECWNDEIIIKQPEPKVLSTKEEINKMYGNKER